MDGECRIVDSQLVKGNPPGSAECRRVAAHRPGKRQSRWLKWPPLIILTGEGTHLESPETSDFRHLGTAMKCQYCDRTATLHITELTDGKAIELHLCKEHAQEYLAQADSGQPSQPSESASSFAHHLTVGNTAEDLARLDQKVCPVCGISFYEFRNAGRLGCPNDYACFQQELEGLLLNIHGETKHEGKVPAGGATNLAEHTRLIQMRRQLKEAVSEENYELASKIRDEIRDLQAEFRREKSVEPPVAESEKPAKPRKRRAAKPKPADDSE